MTIAIPPDLQQALAEYARRQNKPVEQYVLDLLRVAVAPLTGPRRRALTEEDGDVGLRASALRDARHEVDEIVVGRPDTDAVQTEKDEAGRQADALVPIDEGMVLDQVK